MFGNGKNERPAVKGGERGLVCWRGQRGYLCAKFYRSGNQGACTFVIGLLAFAYR